MPIYEYECECGKRLELYRHMDKRHDVLCECGRKPTLLISKPADDNPYRTRITLTLIDGDGNVIGKRHDHTRTPSFMEYHPKEVLDATQYGQEMAHKELLQEKEIAEENKLARQV